MTGRGTIIWGDDRDKIERSSKDGIIKIEEIRRDRGERLRHMEWEYRKR